MRPTANKEFRDLAPLFGVTCTKGTMMMGVSRSLATVGEGEEIPLFAATLPAYRPLVEMAEARDNVLTLEILCEYFSSLTHAEQIVREGTIIGHELPVHPAELRPVIHVLMPLEGADTYVNGDVRLTLRNLVEVGTPTGEGFWAAHMASRVWIQRGEAFRQEMLRRQAESGFTDWVRKVAEAYPVIDFEHYKRLRRQTEDALAECLPRKGHCS